MCGTSIEWYDVSHVKLLQLSLLFFLFIVISRVNVIVHVNVHANVHVIVIAHAIAPVHDDVIKWKHFPRNWPFVRGIHRSPVYSPHKGQWRRALMFSLICVWINDWVNNREAGDLRRYRVHYDVIVMPFPFPCHCHIPCHCPLPCSLYIGIAGRQWYS